MSSYKEMVRDATYQKSVQYLLDASCETWPTPEPILCSRKDGTPHIKQPQNIGKKIQRIINDCFKPTSTTSPRERWLGIKVEEGRGMVEDRLGAMLEGELNDIKREDAVEYGVRDADATLRVYHELWPMIQERGLEQTFWIDMGIIPMVLDMMNTGIGISEGKFEELIKHFIAQKKMYGDKIDGVAGWGVNPGSGPDVAKLLFDQLGLTSIRKTPTGLDSTKDDVLGMLETQHIVVKDIRKYREYEKLRNTYAEPLSKMAGSDGKIHTSIRITSTDTGRLSTADPNLMAIPNRTEDGRRLRKAFIAREGCTFVSADYSQIELRVLAHESQDPNMLEAFNTGVDIHSATASKMFELPIAELDSKEHRRPAKTINFGIVYGAGGSKLRGSMLADGADEKVWTLEKCEKLISDWLNVVYPGVKTYMNKVYGHAKRHGYVVDMWGRQRLVPGAQAYNKWVVAKALRQAGNMPIQSGAQGVIKKAMGELTTPYKDFQSDGFVCDPLLQIHDDLLFEVSDELIPIWTPIMIGIMEGVVKLDVPTPVDPQVGKSWGGMSDYGN